MNELERVIEGVNKFGIPEHLKEVIIEYVYRGRPTGGFLEAIFSNDLVGAFGRADFESMEGIPEIVKWLYNKAPRGCWGSKEIYIAWIDEVGGVKGLSDD